MTHTLNDQSEVRPKIQNASDMTPAMRDTAEGKFALLRQQSIVLKAILGLEELQAHPPSMRTLTHSVYYLRCKACEALPVITMAVVFHSQGVIHFFENGIGTTEPPPQQLAWTISNGVHFLLGHRCPECGLVDYIIITTRQRITRLIQAYIKQMYAPEVAAIGSPAIFEVQPSWMDAYFHRKEGDLAFMQKVTSACLQGYWRVKTALHNQVIASNLFPEEVTARNHEVTHQLLFDVHSETQFCGLVKGVYLFFLMYYLDRVHTLPSLDPTNHSHFSIVAVQKEFRPLGSSLSSEIKKQFLASAILFINSVYRLLVGTEFPVPSWVTAHKEFLREH